MQGLLVQLKQDDDEMSQLDALGQLNELLSISNEESLSMFPLDQLIPTLVGGMPWPPMLPPPPPSPLPHTDAHWPQVMTGVWGASAVLPITICTRGLRQQDLPQQTGSHVRRLLAGAPAERRAQP